MKRLLVALLLVLLAPTLAVASDSPAGAGGDATTAAGGVLRDGWFSDAAGQTSSSQFTQLFGTQLQGQIYAQPVLADDTMFVATEQNWIYGLDPSSGAVRWSRNVGRPFEPASIGCSDLSPFVGITGTPVIDQSSGTVYFLAKSYPDGDSSQAPIYQMHAVGIDGGAERSGFPVTIAGAADNNAAVSFSAQYQVQRAGLLLRDGVIYAAFAGHCDIIPYHGWVIGVNTGGQITSRWTDSDNNSYQGGIWQSGGGLASDGPGQILLATGNGNSPLPDIDASQQSNLGDSVVRLHVQSDGLLQASDFFTPSDAETLDEEDLDLGSAGPLLLPAQYFGTPSHPDLALQAGKMPTLYLLDASRLRDGALAQLPVDGAVFGHPAVWPGDGGYVYVTTTAGTLDVFRYDQSGGSPQLIPVGKVVDLGGRVSAPAVTSDQTRSGSALVWVLATADPAGRDGELRAYAAAPENGTLQLVYRDQVGAGNKMVQLASSQGRIYFGSYAGRVYGYGPTNASPGPSSAPAGSDTISAVPKRVAAVAVSAWDRGPKMGFRPSVLTVRAGTVIFHFRNNGTMAHNLVFGLSKHTPLVQPGKKAALTVRFRPGRYEFYCSVPGHAELGMRGVLVVVP